MLQRNPHATPVVDALTYYVDLMNWFHEGHRLTEVYARGQKGVLKAAGYPEVEDISYAILTYEDGAVVNLGISYALPEKYPALGHAARVEVVGTDGEALARALLQPPYRTFLLPGSAYGLPQHIRIGAGGGPEARLEEGLERLSALLRSGQL